MRKAPKIEVDFVWTENAYKIYLSVTSKTLTYDELTSKIKLRPLDGWSIGEIGHN